MRPAVPSIIILSLLLSVPGIGAQTEKRLSGLEKRVTKVEKRVTAIEQGGSPSAAGAAAAKQAVPAEPKDPIAVYFIKKKQYVTAQKMGVSLFLELENVSRRKYYAFDGVMVFRDESGAVIWSNPYGYSEPLSPGERAEVTVEVSQVKAKEYLKFVKARAVTVAFEKQQVYGAD